MTRQRKWQLKQQTLGRCVSCGRPKGAGRLCLFCRETMRTLTRKIKGCGVYKEGGRGRHPIDPIKKG